MLCFLPIIFLFRRTFKFEGHWGLPARYLVHVQEVSSTDSPGRRVANPTTTL